MKHLIGLLASFGLYIIITLPHILYIMSQGEMGIKYPFWLVVLIAMTSGFVGQIMLSKYERK